LLPTELSERAEAVSGVISPYLGTTLEQFEGNLMSIADSNRAIFAG